ncbi:MAG: hypothetical protein CL582_22385 [Alteromonadaceae bacterium]|nr:hypothetical protein [Alteromonadaceae bacterium]
MSTNITHLENQLQQAVEALNSFVTQTGSNFDDASFDRVRALQNTVDSARKDLDTANSAEMDLLNLEQVSGTASTLVRFTGTGKSELANVEVSSGTTVGNALQILAELHPDKWGYVSDLTKIRVQRWEDNGSCIEIHDPSTSKVSGGTCHIWVGNKVAGGSL